MINYKEQALNSQQSACTHTCIRLASSPGRIFSNGAEGRKFALIEKKRPGDEASIRCALLCTVQ